MYSTSASFCFLTVATTKDLHAILTPRVSFCVDLKVELICCFIVTLARHFRDISLDDD